MALFKHKYKTESNRLKNWDYSSEAIYFITMVAQNRECIFGKIENGEMVLSNKGKIIKNELLKSYKIRDNWVFHNCIIMPNHIHLLIEISNNYDLLVETHRSASKTAELPSMEINDNTSQLQSADRLALSRKSNSISSFVAIFKSVTTHQINLLEGDALRCVSTEQRCVSKIWQANYHDHIVRNYDSFEKIYLYIKNNPKNWNNDSIKST